MPLPLCAAELKIATALHVSWAFEPWWTAELLEAAVAELETVGARGTNWFTDSGIESVNEGAYAVLQATGLERIGAQVGVAR